METKQQISCMKNVSYKKDKDEPLLARKQELLICDSKTWSTF